MTTDEKFIKKLGMRVSDLRNQKNMSQQDLIEQTAISRTTIYRIESGLTLNCSIIDLRKISKVLGIRLSELVDIE